MMTLSVRLYVAFIVVAATAAAVWVYSADPAVHATYMEASLSFAVLGIAAHVLAHKRASPAVLETMSFLPLLAMIVLAPHWTALLGAGIAIMVGELLSDRPPLKSVFNIALTVVQSGLSIVVYRALGGGSLLEPGGFSFLALCAALPLFLLINTVGLAGVLALANRSSFVTLLAEQNVSRIFYDLLTLPFVFVFAWFYVQFGPTGAALLALPLFGIRELYKTNDALERTNQELLELMVAAIEARDPYTSGHSRRVAANTRLIAEAIGLKKKQVDRVYTAALLHDVGKIYEVFGPILSKPGRLTPDELAIMKTHSALGADLVSRVTQLADVVEPIRHHHENWDGTGYPDGVAGESIPLSSRIIMFADTVDAMMSDRPYRAALSPLQVRHEISRLSGKQFDPVIADRLLASPLWARLFENAPQVAVRAHAQSRVAASIASA